jgi:hypothetical protein
MTLPTARAPPRVGTLHWERGAFEPTVWHLGQALLPALERPGEMGAMYAEHLLLASHTYFAFAFGGMRLPAHCQRSRAVAAAIHRAPLDSRSIALQRNVSTASVTVLTRSVV